MGRFRDRMDEELRIRGYSANTRECYLRRVRHFVRHFRTPPDRLTPEHVRQYQLYFAAVTASLSANPPPNAATRSPISMPFSTRARFCRAWMSFAVCASASLDSLKHL